MAWGITSQFILSGLTDNPKTQLAFFMVFLHTYIIILLANLGMIVLIQLDARLHNPMYFSDLCYSSFVVPKTLANFLDERKAISFTGCAMQFYFYAVFATVECRLLAAMAYDHYVAICNPLMYPVLMSRKAYIWLVVASFLHVITFECKVRVADCVIKSGCAAAFQSGRWLTEQVHVTPLTQQEATHSSSDSNSCLDIAVHTVHKGTTGNS
ncbi:Olfactory receptor-like protein OLF1 [Chelonia mydas]|uniref:Olfactory receptor-like protein OLF1 n=1 Tax=Chelonia mydas TaxID=8469 RepID=M7APF2_CHEMY|nr:Olfactory receptor-like protein OLF1 [Chelonia mydas]